jgi:hypothetical protein
MPSDQESKNLSSSNIQPNKLTPKISGAGSPKYNKKNGTAEGGPAGVLAAVARNAAKVS